MNILITGGSGFVGSQLAIHLQQRGHRVLAMDNLVRRGSEMNLPRLRHHGVEFLHGDVRNPEDLSGLPADIDLVCEASAQPSVVSGYDNPMFDISNNAFGVINVLEFVRRRGCALLYWSTNRVYSAERLNAPPRREAPTRLVWDAEQCRVLAANGALPGFDPEHGFSEACSLDGSQRTIYGLSKLMADLACQEYCDAFGVRAVVNRFGVLCGEGQFGKPDQGWATWWTVAFHFGLPLTYLGWGGKQVRDLLFIEDVCRLIELEMGNIDRIAGHVFNVGGGLERSLSLVEATSLLREKVGRDVPVSVERQPRKGDLAIYATDNRKVQQTLGWSPRIGVSEGFDRILAWVREHEKELAEMYSIDRMQGAASRA